MPNKQAQQDREFLPSDLPIPYHDGVSLLIPHKQLAADLAHVSEMREKLGQFVEIAAFTESWQAGHESVYPDVAISGWLGEPYHNDYNPGWRDQGRMAKLRSLYHPAHDRDIADGWNYGRRARKWYQAHPIPTYPHTVTSTPLLSPVATLPVLVSSSSVPVFGDKAAISAAKPKRK